MPVEPFAPLDSRCRHGVDSRHADRHAAPGLRRNDLREALGSRLGRPIIAYDRLGFGRSSPRRERPTADFLREEVEDFFPAVLDGLGIGRFALFGHSVGGVLALMAAARSGGRCCAVVSESAQAFVEERTLEGVAQARVRFQDPGQFDRLRKWHGEKSRWVLAGWTEVWLAPEFATWSLAPDLADVTCPVLVLHGDQDEFGSTRFPELIAQSVRGPAELHILEGCGHIPHRERPGRVLEIASRFFKTVGG